MKLHLGAALALLLAAQAPAHALTIELFDLRGVSPGTPQYKAFRTAANYWESLVSTDTTVRVDMEFYGQGATGPTGSTNAYYYVDTVGTILSAMQAVGSGSAVDRLALAHLPDASSGAIAMWTPGYTDAVAKTGADPASVVFDNDGSNNNFSYGVTWALGKALGLVAVDGLKDGSIGFNSDVAFDFDPTDGIKAGAYDFTFTAFHELGHILGFTSGVDYYDAFAPSNGYNWNLDWIGHGMDLFRYSSRGLDWSLGGSPFFSVDGGASALLGGDFSTGINWGNGSGAAHWLEGQGMMDPTAARGEMGVLTALDVAAFDALGWNFAGVDPLADPGLRVTTAQMWAAMAVPEPASSAAWGALALALGAAATRRRRRGLAAAPARADAPRG